MHIHICSQHVVVNNVKHMLAEVYYVFKKGCVQAQPLWCLPDDGSASGPAYRVCLRSEDQHQQKQSVGHLWISLKYGWANGYARLWLQAAFSLLFCVFTLPFPLIPTGWVQTLTATGGKGYRGLTDLSPNLKVRPFVIHISHSVCACLWSALWDVVRAAAVLSRGGERGVAINKSAGS